MSSQAIRERRRTLRYRNLVVKQMVQMKNRVSCLLMEDGVSYDKQRLHRVGYFCERYVKCRCYEGRVAELSSSVGHAD